MRVRALLSGGIGSGKSTAAGILAGLGAFVLSADDAARRVVEPGTPGYHEVAAHWPGVVADDGSIDRTALAGIVFADAGARRRLEAIIHPAVAAWITLRVAEAADPVVIVEVPLLTGVFGEGWTRIVVDAPAETRMRRVVARGMDPGDAAARMAAQPTREEWLAAADHVIDNSGDLARLEGECRRVWANLTGAGPVTRPR